MGLPFVGQKKIGKTSLVHIPSSNLAKCLLWIYLFVLMTAGINFFFFLDI